MHFRVAEYLPTRECIKEDLKRDESFDLSFVHNAFVQPALASKKEVSPDPSLLESVHEFPVQPSLASEK